MRVEAPGSVELHEHASLSIVIYNRWTEDIDVLIIVKESPDYAPVDWDRDSSAAIIGNGELQVNQMKWWQWCAVVWCGVVWCGVVW